MIVRALQFIVIFLNLDQLASFYRNVDISGVVFDGYEENDYLLSTCNNLPIVRKNNLLKSCPADTVAVNRTFVDLFPNNVTAYRFVNPAGTIFDGICAQPILTPYVLFSNEPPVSEHSWFKGYSWKIVYCSLCEISTAHLGWAFYTNTHLFPSANPSFIFYIISASMAELRERQEIHLQLGAAQVNRTE